MSVSSLLVSFLLTDFCPQMLLKKPFRHTFKVAVIFPNVNINTMTNAAHEMHVTSFF